MPPDESSGIWEWPLQPGQRRIRGNNAVLTFTELVSLWRETQYPELQNKQRGPQSDSFA